VKTIAHSVLLEKRIFEPSRPGSGIVDHAIKKMLSFGKSSNPATYPTMAIIKFATIAHTAIHAICHSVTCVNLYSPWRRETLSVFASTSNSRTPSHRKNPFVKRVMISGSQSIGSGFLKCMSFLNQYW